LDAALGSREAVGLDVDAPSLLGVVRDAVEEGRSLSIEYLSGSRDELTTRVVDPVQVVTIDGHWYLDAYCHRAGDMRRFRVDRIVTADVVEPTGDPQELPAYDRPLDEMFVPGPGAVEVHLRLGRRAEWLIESVPVRSVTDDGDDAVEVVLDVSGMAWFERLLLQLGTEAVVLEPEELRGLAASAAGRVLARYR
jgi:proteasome accessory factor C